MNNLYKFLVPLLLVLSFIVDAEEIIEGRVVGVHDGDTVTLLISGNQQLKIRLAQIDAPESDQAFGQRSKQTLSDMVFNKSIQVKKETIDKYGRTVGTIIVDGIDANKEQIKRGMAWVYRQYLHDKSLIQLEEEAQKLKIGLWSDPNPIPPWEYRHSGKVEKPCVKADLTGRWTAVINDTGSNSIEQCKIIVNSAGKLTSGSCKDIQRNTSYTFRSGSTTINSQCSISLTINFNNGTVSKAIGAINRARDLIVGTFKEKAGNFGTFSAVKY